MVFNVFVLTPVSQDMGIFHFYNIHLLITIIIASYNRPYKIRRYILTLYYSNIPFNQLNINSNIKFPASDASVILLNTKPPPPYLKIKTKITFNNL